MPDTVDNLTIRLVQDIRSEMNGKFAEISARDEKAQAQIGVMAQGLNGVGAELIRIREHIGEITIAIDHHSVRLDRIEEQLGLDKAMH